jgi:hydrogenase maturation protease
MKDLKTNSNKVLLIGIGNSGRGDDGLGWEFTDMLKRYDYNFLDYEYRYQLQIEDTVLISRYDTVIFADASHAVLENGFEVKGCEAANHYFFSSHIQSPETILYLANDLYNKHPEAFTVAISGNYWDLKTSLSKVAEKNLQSAFSFFVKDFLPTIQPKTKVKKDQFTA